MKTDPIELCINALTSSATSAQEKQRAHRDLLLIRERLRTGVYRNGEPLENCFEIPNRNAEIAWDLRYLRSLGLGWEALVRHAGVATAASVLSICTGSRPKAELGLAFAGFAGQLTCLNRDPRELEEMSAFLDLFGVRWRIQSSSSDLFAAPAMQYPVILGNHIIDDLCYDQFAHAVQLTPGEIYADERCAVMFWERIQPAEVAREVSRRLAAALVGWCAPQGTIILVQYASPFERVLGLSGCLEVSHTILNNLAEAHPEGLKRVAVSTTLGESPIRPEDCCVLRRL